MKLAIMQPYFFPYIGYWQLINAVDSFILFDDVQFMRHSWINRNRVLKHGGGWQYIAIPLAKHSMKDKIKNILVNDASDWHLRIFRQLEHYNYGYSKAHFYNEVIDLLQSIFSKITHVENVANVNALIVKEICLYLDVQTQITLSSEHNFNYSEVYDSGEWALRIAEQMDASEYINPIAGKELFDPAKFQASNIKLSFLKSEDISYQQGKREFEPWLSIVDVLMFNGKTGTKEFLKNYSKESIL